MSLCGSICWRSESWVGRLRTEQVSKRRCRKPCTFIRWTGGYFSSLCFQCLVCEDARYLKQGVLPNKAKSSTRIFLLYREPGKDRFTITVIDDLPPEVGWLHFSRRLDNQDERESAVRARASKALLRDMTYRGSCTVTDECRVFESGIPTDLTYAPRRNSN